MRSFCLHPSSSVLPSYLLRMDVLYHQTNRNLHEAQSCFVRLEKATSLHEGQAIEREIHARVDQLISNCERLDILVQKEPVARRQNAKIRVDQLKSDVHHLQSSLRSLQANQWAREQEERDRHELLNTRFTTNAASRQNGSSSDTSILIDRALEHSNALNRSRKGVDDLLDHGQTILETLRDQRSTLKNIQKRIFDVANYLGMSGTVMRLIERRQEGDKYILVGGMVITCIVMVVVIRYFT